MLRSLAETAVDDVVESCRAAADHFASTVGAADDTGLAGLLETLRQEHADRAAALEGAIRRQGELPSAPDADREALQHLVTRVRAALSRNERRVLLEESLRVESFLAARLEIALGHQHPPEIAALLKELQNLAGSALERLAAARDLP